MIIILFSHQSKLLNICSRFTQVAKNLFGSSLSLTIATWSRSDVLKNFGDILWHYKVFGIYGHTNTNRQPTALKRHSTEQVDDNLHCKTLSEGAIYCKFSVDNNYTIKYAWWALYVIFEVVGTAATVIVIELVRHSNECIIKIVFEMKC